MKKSLLLTVVGSLCSIFVMAASPIKKIELEDRNPHTDNVRSVVFRPSVQLNPDANTLSVRFASAAHYILKVEDATGATIFATQLITDGNNQTYMLPVLENGSYNIVLESSSKTYSGLFFIAN